MVIVSSKLTPTTWNGREKKWQVNWIVIIAISASSNDRPCELITGYNFMCNDDVMVLTSETGKCRCLDFCLSLCRLWITCRIESRTDDKVARPTKRSVIRPRFRIVARASKLAAWCGRSSQFKRHQDEPRRKVHRPLPAWRPRGKGDAFFPVPNELVHYFINKRSVPWRGAWRMFCRAIRKPHWPTSRG